MRMNVVVVEDDDWLAEHYTRVLERAGYEVEHAPHAVSAITVIDRVQPTVIVLDMLLTGTTAMALLHELQSHTDLAGIPVVLITNLADQLRLNDVRGYGVVRIVDKATMQPDDIVAAVRGAAL